MKQLNDILGYPVKIYQDKDWFCFSLDSVLLANFVPLKLSTKRVMDLGTGNGIIPLILSLRTNADIYGIDIQKDLVELAKESVKYNRLDSRIFIDNMDIKLLKNQKEIFNSFDLVVSNPPYFFDYEKSTKNLNIHKTIARHEVLVKLEDVLYSSFLILKEGGTFSMINRTDRLLEILDLFRKFSLEPKKIKFIYKNSNSESNMVYIEGIKNGRPGLKILSPFVIYNLDGTYSFEYLEICRKVL